MLYVIHYRFILTSTLEKIVMIKLSKSSRSHYGQIC